MKKKLLLGLAIASFATCASYPFIARSAMAGERTVDNVFCLRNLKSSVSRVTKTSLPDGYDDLQDVHLRTERARRVGMAWASAGMGPRLLAAAAGCAAAVADLEACRQ